MEEKPVSTEGEIATSSVEQPPAEPLTPSFWEKLKANKFKILGGILGIFVLAGAVFGAYKLGQRQIQPQPSPTPEVVATPTSDLTANWKTYNAEFYEIKYPPNWKIESDAVSPQPDGTFIRSTQFNDDRECEVRFATGGKCGRISISSYSFADRSVEHKFAGQPTTPLAGEQAWVIPYELIEQNNTYVSDMAITYKGKTFEIQLQHFPGYEDYRDTFNLMLSTFRFLAEEEDWKTYINTKYGYSIKYPSTFLLPSETEKTVSFLLANSTIPAEQAVYIFVEENPQNFEFIEWLRSPEIKQEGTISEPTVELKIKEEIISGINWLSFEESEIPLGFPPAGEIYWATSHKDKVFLVGLLNLNYQEYKPTVNLMLSTFRFLD